MLRILRDTSIVALLLLSTSQAQAFGWGLFRSSSYYSSPSYSYYYTPSYYSSAYYYPATSYYVPSVAYYSPSVTYYVPTTVVRPAVVCQPAPTVSAPTVTTPPPLANPTPAPPSGTNQDNTRVSTGSTSFYRAGGDSVRVGFWNVSGGEKTLFVNGEVRTLASGRAVTLNLPRDFTWQISGNTSQREIVPSNRDTFEIILRR